MWTKETNKQWVNCYCYCGEIGSLMPMLRVRRVPQYQRINARRQRKFYFVVRLLSKVDVACMCI